jgi:phage gp29-like protein
MAKKTSDIFTEIATRQNLQNFFNEFSFLPDPDLILQKAGKEVSAYRALLTDAHVASNIMQRKGGVLSMNWNVTGNDKSRVDFIRNVLGELNIYGIMNQMLNSVLFGFTVLEVLWQKNGSTVIPVAVEEKPREWFRFDSMNRLCLVAANGNSGTLAEQYPYKFLLLQHNPDYMNPYGDKILSKCFWPVQFKKGGLQFWTVFMEKYGMPHATAQVSRNATEEEQTKVLNALATMVQDAVAVVPEGTTVSIEKQTGTAIGDLYKMYVEFMNTEISKAILSQTLTTELQKSGSFAASETHQNMLEVLSLSDKRIVEASMNKLIDYIQLVNFASALPVSFYLSSPEQVNKTLAERDKILTETGIEFTESYYTRAHGLQNTDFRIKSATAAAAFSAPEGLVVSASDDLAKMQKPVNDLIESLLKKNGISQSMYQQILAAVLESQDFDQLTQSLIELYPSLDTQSLTTLLEKAIFIADIYGQSTTEAN